MYITAASDLHKAIVALILSPLVTSACHAHTAVYKHTRIGSVLGGSTVGVTVPWQQTMNRL